MNADKTIKDLKYCIEHYNSNECHLRNGDASCVKLLLIDALNVITEQQERLKVK